MGPEAAKFKFRAEPEDDMRRMQQFDDGDAGNCI